MSREDIGSYLHLTTETVSRLVSKMKEEALIAVKGKEIELLNLAALEALCSLGVVRTYAGNLPIRNQV
jgi:CRP/FNR family transcriptional regulator